MGAAFKQPDSSVKMSGVMLALLLVLGQALADEHDHTYQVCLESQATFKKY